MDYPSTTILTALSHPAYLIIGEPDTVTDYSITILQKQLCPQQGCAVCKICRQIREQQHPSLLWMHPEKQYVIDDLKGIFSALTFALEPQEHFYFILQKADLLTPVCANALLKSLEEPPHGYHFILLAQRFDAILPTIKSRCIIKHLNSPTTAFTLPSLAPFFITQSFQDPAAFLQELESSNPTEVETLMLLDQLLAFWLENYKKSCVMQDKHHIKQAEWMVNRIKKAILNAPMPGSSKLFWKNLFLEIKELS